MPFCTVIANIVAWFEEAVLNDTTKFTDQVRIRLFSKLINII